MLGLRMRALGKIVIPSGESTNVNPFVQQASCHFLRAVLMVVLGVLFLAI